MTQRTGMGNVFQTDKDFNIGIPVSGNVEMISGLFFDTQTYTDETLWAKSGWAGAADFKAGFQNKVVEFDSWSEVLDNFESTLGGDADKNEPAIVKVARTQINNYFRAAGTESGAKLFVCFANGASANGAIWTNLIGLQKAASGNLSQIGVYTEMPLWKVAASGDGAYELTPLTRNLNKTAEELAKTEYSAPTVIILNGKTLPQNANGEGFAETVSLEKIPNIKGTHKKEDNPRYVAVYLGENIGCATGALAASKVHINIAWVQNYDFGHILGEAKLGLKTKADDDDTLFDEVAIADINDLIAKGYNVTCKYAGVESGVFLSGDTTCAHPESDFRTVSRNRTINKTRRLARAVLLPYVNSPIYVDPATGTLSAATVTEFKLAVQGVLDGMVANGEISGVAFVNVPADQKVLQTDTVNLSYGVVPVGSAKYIEVSEGLYVSQG